MKRGTKPQGKVSLVWNSNFAYAIGLLTADGCLSKDGRHLDFTSKDKSLIVLFKKCLGLKAKISPKYSGSGKLYYHTQFSDVLLYHFLVSIGLMPAKSKKINYVSIPDLYFSDFLRGYFDGDGTSYSYYDPVFHNSYRFYISFACASPKFLDWLRKKLKNFLQIKGHLSYSINTTCVQLRYSKKEAMAISKFMYYNAKIPYLKRKYFKIERSLNNITNSMPRWRNW